MKDLGKQRSTVEPLNVEILQTKVFVASNISPVEEIIGEETFNGYEFDIVEYDKDEYIEMLDERNKSLEENITQTQIALCDVYELIGG